MAKRHQIKNLPKVIRAEIKRQKLSQYRIAIDTGIRQPSLSKFLNGGSLKLETAAVLLDYLGFHLTTDSKVKSRY